MKPKDKKLAMAKKVKDEKQMMSKDTIDEEKEVVLQYDDKEMFGGKFNVN
jgi:hypothetical protein